MDTQLFSKLKSGELTIDEVLYPEVHVSEVPVDSLKVDIMPSGFQSLDDLMFIKKDRGQLIIIAGRPGMGKTAFMLNISKSIGKDLPVYFFSLEMGRDELKTRLLSDVINKSVTQIMQGKVTNAALTQGNRELSKINLFILDSGVHYLPIFLDAAKSLVKRRGPGIIVLDYLQLLRGEKGHSTTAEVSEITRSLKLLANELRVPIIAGSQLNRQCELRGVQSGDYRPIMSDLRDSGAIEQDADTIAFVHRQYVYTRAPEDRGKASVIIAKNRHGALAELDFTFSEYQTKFIEEVKI